MASDTPAAFSIEVASSAAALDASDWNACASGVSSDIDSMVSDNDSGRSQTDSSCENDSAVPPNPFSDHAFYTSCEDSGSAVPEQGWAARHLVARDSEGLICGIMPSYLKGHSYGEYVFDHAWAEAYERAGGRYYPKLQSAFPFTPATGPRMFVRSGQDRQKVQQSLLAGAQRLLEQARLSSHHVTFCREEEMQAYEEAGYLRRIGEQFHWFNRGYATFEDFLSVLQSRKRKAIRRERRDALSGNGITIDWLTGSQLTEDVWDHFFAFYLDTGSRKWGRPYLTRSFFSMIGERMAERILLVVARREGRLIAGALNFIGQDTLYGRQWGAVEEHPFLHFELCYYQAIDFAIQHKLRCIEAGAQGEHKLARGYEPVATLSAHRIQHEGLRDAVEDFLRRERRALTSIIAETREMTPFNFQTKQNTQTLD